MPEASLAPVHHLQRMRTPSRGTYGPILRARVPATSARLASPALGVVLDRVRAVVTMVTGRVDEDPSQRLDLDRLLADGVMHGDALELLPRLAAASVDLFFMSPPYADQRAYSRIHPDRYVEWFLPFARAMYDATSETGSMVLNIKNRVANRGPLRGQRHPYVRRHAGGARGVLRSRDVPTGRRRHRSLRRVGDDGRRRPAPGSARGWLRVACGVRGGGRSPDREGSSGGSRRTAADQRSQLAHRRRELAELPSAQ